MENIKDSTSMRDQSTFKLQIAMSNSSCDPSIGINLQMDQVDSRRRMALKVSSINGAETSKAGAATYVESIHREKKRDIFGSLCRDAQFPQHHHTHTNLRYSESGDFYGNLNSSVFDLEEKIGKRSKSQAFTGENFQNIWNFSGPKHTSRSPPKNNSEKMYDEVETTRICTTVVDSVVGLCGKHSSTYSQTTQSLLIKKNSDSNLFKDDQIFLNSRGGSDFGRHPFSKPNSVTPIVSNLHRFADSKPLDKSRKGKMVLYESESSAETDTMDLTNSERIHGHGVSSSLPVKVINLGFSTAPRVVSFRGEEDRLGQHKLKLPDMNLEAPTSSADEQTLEYQEPITSRTQSLDKETVLSHAEHVNPLESVNDLHAGGRWLKRLKFIDPASDLIGKKSSDCMEESRHERANLSLKRFLESSMALASKNHGKEPMVVDEAMTLKTRGETPDVELAKKNRELLVSKSWISRWCRHEETPKKIPNAGGEPRNSNLLVEGRNKKQFPSIGAMALMAKTMNCMETYDVRNRGAVMVWNTKGF